MEQVAQRGCEDSILDGVEPDGAKEGCTQNRQIFH